MRNDVETQVPFDDAGADSGRAARGGESRRRMIAKLVAILVLFPLVVWCFRIPLTNNLRNELLPDSWNGGKAWLEERPHCWAWKTCMTVTPQLRDSTQTFILPSCAAEPLDFATNEDYALIVTYPDCGNGRATIRIYLEDFASHNN